MEKHNICPNCGSWDDGLNAKNLSKRNFVYFFSATIGGMNVHFEATVDSRINSIENIRDVIKNVLPQFKSQVPKLKNATSMIVTNFIFLRFE